MSVRAKKARRAARRGVFPQAGLPRADFDAAIRDVAHVYMLGDIDHADVRDELIRRGFSEPNAFLILTAGRLLARCISSTT